MEKKNVHVTTGRHVIADPRVSVIMPAYNVACYISGAIESVLVQTFTAYEIIVVNDGSPDTDALEESLRPYSDLIVYAIQEHGGVASARNTGLRLAQAPIIAQLDPDDEWFPEFLSTLMAMIEIDPGPDVVYSNAVIFGGTGLDGVQTMKLSPSIGKVTFDSLVSQKCTVMSSLIGKKDIFFRAGCFDESLHASEDFDMWLRIIKSGGQINYHPAPLARYRRRRDSLSADNVLMSESILRVLSKTDRSQKLTPTERANIAQSKLKWEAFLNLCEGKRAMVNGNVDLAIDRLTTANQYYRRRKIALMIKILQIAPEFALNILRRRLEDS